jgi:S1-C subfamily serine protease
MPSEAKKNIFRKRNNKKMRTLDLFDNYINGKLGPEEITEFEIKLKTDLLFANAFIEHVNLINTLNQAQFRSNLKRTLNQIHLKEIGPTLNIISINREQSFFKKYTKTLAIAASSALIAVMITVSLLMGLGYLSKKQSNQITDLNRVGLERKSKKLINIKDSKSNAKEASYRAANIEGSAFALNNKGYIVTSFHMVNGADSIFIENDQIDRACIKVIFTDANLDLAILKIVNSDLVAKWRVPFSIKEKNADVGEKVFTLGYPRNEIVYGDGSLSSLSGYSNDKSMYQISIPVNPGNSGGPLLDENANVIGVIRGKISGEEGTGFAIKSNEILKAISELENDSLKQELMSQNKRNQNIKNLKRSEQIKLINPYVFNVLVYKKD